MTKETDSPLNIRQPMIVSDHNDNNRTRKYPLVTASSFTTEINVLAEDGH